MKIFPHPPKSESIFWQFNFLGNSDFFWKNTQCTKNTAKPTEMWRTVAVIAQNLQISNTSVVGLTSHQDFIKTHLPCGSSSANTSRGQGKTRSKPVIVWNRGTQLYLKKIKRITTVLVTFGTFLRCLIPHFLHPWNNQCVAWVCSAVHGFSPQYNQMVPEQPANPTGNHPLPKHSSSLQCATYFGFSAAWRKSM